MPQGLSVSLFKMSWCCLGHAEVINKCKTNAGHIIDKQNLTVSLHITLKKTPIISIQAKSLHCRILQAFFLYTCNYQSI